MTEEIILKENKKRKVKEILLLITFGLALAAAGLSFYNFQHTTALQANFSADMNALNSQLPQFLVICDVDQNGSMLYDTKTGKPNCFPVSSVVYAHQQALVMQNQRLTAIENWINGLSKESAN